jgi:hypothetical protein
MFFKQKYKINITLDLTHILDHFAIVEMKKIDKTRAIEEWVRRMNICQKNYTFIYERVRSYLTHLLLIWLA